MQANFALSAEAAWQLHEHGFVVLPDAVAPVQLSQFAAAYDEAVANADPADIRVGSTTTRVNDFVNRAPIFDALYLAAPILAASCRVIGRPFKLSTLHARTLHPGATAQRLHVDFPRDDDGWPMLGFIFMVDEFRVENGATRFVPGSQHSSQQPVNESATIAAGGAAGSVILYNGAVWHGHGTNQTNQPRRSLQGAYIRRTATAGGQLPARMLPATLERISPLAKYLLAL